MFSVSKLKIYGIVIGIIALISVVALWRIEVSHNKVLTEQNCMLTDDITRLKNENDRLTEYNKKKEAELEKVNKEYVERLKYIPEDSCGDSYPSDELLKYLRGE